MFHRDLQSTVMLEERKKDGLKAGYQGGDKNCLY